MRSARLSITVLACLTAVAAGRPHQAAAPAAAQKQEPPKIQVAQLGVPRIMTIEGWYVGIACNNEGFVTLGGKLASLSVGEPWILLEVGFPVLDRVPDYPLTPDALTRSTPDVKAIPLPSVEEFRGANDTRALQNRENVVRDSIHYFLPGAHDACSVQFFTQTEGRAMSWETTPSRGIEPGRATGRRTQATL